MKDMKQETVIAENDVCFGRCQVNTENKCINREFKTKSDKTKCCVFSLVLTCLLISVILPPVVYRFADDIINHEVVIDSVDHENYDTWQNNVFGEGKVCTVYIYIMWMFLTISERVYYNISSLYMSFNTID